MVFSFWFIMIIRIHPCPKRNFLYNILMLPYSIKGGSAFTTAQVKRSTPSFGRRPGPGMEGDSCGLQGAGSSLERAGFSRGFSAALRSRLPLRKDLDGPGRILSRRDSSSIAIPPGPSWRLENWGWASAGQLESEREHLDCPVNPSFSRRAEVRRQGRDKVPQIIAADGEVGQRIYFGG